jgi:hypothetical protein
MKMDLLPIGFADFLETYEEPKGKEEKKDVCEDCGKYELTTDLQKTPCEDGKKRCTCCGLSYEINKAWEGNQK